MPFEGNVVLIPDRVWIVWCPQGMTVTGWLESNVEITLPKIILLRFWNIHLIPDALSTIGSDLWKVHGFEESKFHQRVGIRRTAAFPSKTLTP
jgi:hypothetical protein